MSSVNQRTVVKSDCIKPPSSLNFLYNNAFGRAILKVLVCPFVSKLGGKYMDSAISKGRIKKFVEQNNINLNDFEKTTFKTYNEFFTRKIKQENRPINFEPSALISPCDSKLSCFATDKNSCFNIKNSTYTVAELLQDEKLANEFYDGYCLVFRLCVDDYHRYCYFDDGVKGENRFLKGKLHTVQPIAVNSMKVFKQNSREYTVMETKNFGKAIQMEVGALMVGKIVNHMGQGSFLRGQEKGLFEFGGSTIILFLQNNSCIIDSDILENSKMGYETVVKYGECIGHKKV